jgi:sporulation integral membrane protein YtvI
MAYYGEIYHEREADMVKTKLNRLLRPGMGMYFVVMATFCAAALIAGEYWLSAAEAVVTLLVFLVCALVLRELGQLVKVLPDLEGAARSGMELAHRGLLGMADRLPPSMEQVLQRNVDAMFSGGTELVDRGVGYVLGLAGGVLSHVPDSALVLGTAIISGYMICGKLPRIRAWIRGRIPRQRLEKVLGTLKRMKGAVLGWMKAQCKLAGVTWGILSAGFLLLRVPYALLWALVVAVLDALPVLGTGIVLLPWALLRLLEGDTVMAVGLLGLYGAAALIRSALEPKLVGRQLGLDPLLTLAAVYVGYRLWGIGGILLAPVMAVAAAQLSPGKGQG